MKIFDVEWNTFKTFAANKDAPVQYVATADRYHILAFDLHFGVQCDVMKETPEATDFETNFLPAANLKLEAQRDKDGAVVVNPKFAGEGRAYQSLHFEMALGTKSFYCKDANLQDLNFIQVMHFKSETEPLAEGDPENLIVKTVVVLTPSFDYDIQGFCLYQNQQPVSDIRFWATMLPFLPLEYGGPKQLIVGANLAISPYGVNFLDYVGDSATTIKNLGPGTHEMAITFRFPAGTNHKVMGELFWYV